VLGRGHLGANQLDDRPDVLPVDLHHVSRPRDERHALNQRSDDESAPPIVVGFSPPSNLDMVGRLAYDSTDRSVQSIHPDAEPDRDGIRFCYSSERVGKGEWMGVTSAMS